MCLKIKQNKHSAAALGAVGLSPGGGGKKVVKNTEIFQNFVLPPPPPPV